MDDIVQCERSGADARAGLASAKHQLNAGEQVWHGTGGALAVSSGGSADVGQEPVTRFSISRTRSRNSGRRSRSLSISGLTARAAQAAGPASRNDSAAGPALNAADGRPAAATFSRGMGRRSGPGKASSTRRVARRSSPNRRSASPPNPDRARQPWRHVRRAPPAAPSPAARPQPCWLRRAR